MAEHVPMTFHDLPDLPGGMYWERGNLSNEWLVVRPGHKSLRIRENGFWETSPGSGRFGHAGNFRDAIVYCVREFTEFKDYVWTQS